MIAKGKRDRERKLIEANAILHSIADATQGQEPSDFMLSFPVVRVVWDLIEQNRKLDQSLGREVELAESYLRERNRLMQENERLRTELNQLRG